MIALKTLSLSANSGFIFFKFPKSKTASSRTFAPTLILLKSIGGALVPFKAWYPVFWLGSMSRALPVTILNPFDLIRYILSRNYFTNSQRDW